MKWVLSTQRHGLVLGHDFNSRGTATCRGSIPLGCQPRVLSAPFAPTAFLGSGERSRMDVKSHAFGAVDFVVSFVNGYLRAL